VKSPIQANPNSGLDGIIDELKASNEEEIAADMQRLIEDISDDETQGAVETKESKALLKDLRERLVGNRLSSLSESIDILLDDESKLSRLDLGDYQELLNKREEKEKEIIDIRKKLEKIKDSDSEKLIVKYAEYLYTHQPYYYQKYINSRRGKIIRGIETQVKEAGDVYHKIKILKPFYDYILRKASE
jgi:hypothetical protein